MKRKQPKCGCPMCAFQDVVPMGHMRAFTADIMYHYFRPMRNPDLRFIAAHCPLCSGTRKVLERWAVAFTLMFPNYCPEAEIDELPTVKDIANIKRM